MIALTEEQVLAVEQAEQLPLLVNPKTQEQFVLVPKDQYQAMQKWMAALKRNWDNPADDDLIRKP